MGFYDLELKQAFEDLRVCFENFKKAFIKSEEKKRKLKKKKLKRKKESRSQYFLGCKGISCCNKIMIGKCIIAKWVLKGARQFVNGHFGNFGNWFTKEIIKLKLNLEYI